MDNERYPGTYRLLTDATNAVIELFGEVGINLPDAAIGRLEVFLGLMFAELLPLQPEVLELIKRRAAQ